MKTIQRNNKTFQTFLELLSFIRRLYFSGLTEPQIYRFPMPVNEDRIALKKAVQLFELKKRGGAR